VATPFPVPVPQILDIPSESARTLLLNYLRPVALKKAEQLLTLLDRLGAEHAANLSSLASTDDRPTIAATAHNSAAIAVILRNALAATQQALANMETDRWGFCVKCESYIEPERLLAALTVDTCCTCAGCRPQVD